MTEENMLLLCQCHNTEHQMIFSYFDDEPDVYVTVHLCKQPFWRRILGAFKYICGYTSKYGDFDEFILQPKDAEKLIKVAKHLNSTSGDLDIPEKGCTFAVQSPH